MKVADLLSRAAKKLSFSETPQLDAQVLMAHILKKSRAQLMAHLDEDIAAEALETIEQALREMGAGKPLPYILGEWEFFGLSFEVSPAVLIPRPETELLVEKALAFLQSSPQKNVADVGAGSGAIAVSIAAHVPAAQILATDISPAALNIAKRNAQRHKVQKQITFVECDLLPNLELRILNSKFDLLCANPPYIPTETLRALPIYGQEPALALDGGADGLSVYRRLFEMAPQYLNPRAALLLEIESTLGAQTAALALQHFPNARVNLHPDLAGKDRLLEIQTCG